MSVTWGSMETNAKTDWARVIGWTVAGVLSGCAWYGILRLAIWFLRLLGVHMVGQ